MMLQLRCDKHQHFQFDPDTERAIVKCRWCSTARHPVYHEWPLREIVERYRRGELQGVCAPERPGFVHWRVV